MLSQLDLFSGIGGFALAARWAGFETVAFCERDAFCRKVLRKNFGDVPCHDDVRTLSGEPFRGVDVLTGGFPCQPFSNAGKRRGSEDDRHLWPEMRRVIHEARPAWVVGENVAGFVRMALDDVLSELGAEGYDAWPLVIPACAVNAPHRRDRVWILAHSRHAEPSGRDAAARSRVGEAWSESASCGASVAYPEVGTERPGLRPNGAAPFGRGRSGDGGSENAPAVPCRSSSPERQGTAGERAHPSTPRSGWWATEPEVCRVAYGIPGRVDRLRSLGNAIVPQVAYEILRGIAAWETPQ